MDIDLLIRVAGVALIVCAAYVIIKKAVGEEHAMLISVVGVVIVLIVLVGKISELLDTIRSLFGL
jgi:stage III sporulation protein AC